MEVQKLGKGTHGSWQSDWEWQTQKNGSAPGFASYKCVARLCPQIWTGSANCSLGVNKGNSRRFNKHLLSAHRVPGTMLGTCYKGKKIVLVLLRKGSSQHGVMCSPFEAFQEFCGSTKETSGSGNIWEVATPKLSLKYFQHLKIFSYKEESYYR